MSSPHMAKVLAGLLLLIPTFSYSGMLSVSNWNDAGSPTADYLLEVDDNTAGIFHFEASVVAPTQADILAIGWGWGDPTLQDGGLYSYSGTGDIGIANIEVAGTPWTGSNQLFVNNDCSGGGGTCNYFSGVPYFFDGILQIGTIGLGDGGILNVAFDIADNGLALEQFSLFAIRAQSVGLNGGFGDDSDKAYATCPNIQLGGPSCFTIETPEPQSALLVLFGLLLIARLKPTK